MADTAIPMPQDSPSDKITHETSNANDNQPPSTTKQPQKRGCLYSVCTILFWIILVPIILIYLFAYCIRSCCRCGAEKNDKQSGSSDVNKWLRPLLGAENQAKADLDNLRRPDYYVNALRWIRNRLALLLLIWLLVNLSVPGLKNNKYIYGTKLWKWSLLLAILLCGYNLINPVTEFLLHCLCSIEKFKAKKNAVYFAKGLRRSVNCILLTGSVLLTWIFYFKRSRGIKKTSNTHEIIHIGSWIFSMLFVGAVLSLIKTILLLKWEANALWRLSDRILNARIQLYFVGRIRGWKLTPRNDKHNPKDQRSNGEGEGAAEDENKQSKGEKKEDAREESKDNKKGDPAKEILCRQWTIDHMKQEKSEKKLKTLTDIKDMEEYFVVLKEISREDDGTKDVGDKCDQIDPGNSSEVTVENLKKLHIEVEEDTLEAVKSTMTDGSTCENFKKWMVKANKNCLGLGYTLSDARDVVNLLDKVMTCLIVVIIIAWFLVSNIANTRILVLIASPFLGATYVFSSTCKTIFEGIIFSFINHPFDVGDRCIIDGAELEVKHMGVLGTRFRSIDAEKEVLYPNSALASKCITNLKWEPDPNDNVEVTLDCNWTYQMLDKLKKRIKDFFDTNQDKQYKKEPTVAIEEIGDSIKMKIQFQHVLSVYEGTHSHCRKKKSTQRSDLLSEVKKFLDEIKQEGVAKTSAEDKPENEAGEEAAEPGVEDKAENQPVRLAKTGAEIQNPNACS